MERRRLLSPTFPEPHRPENEAVPARKTPATPFALWGVPFDDVTVTETVVLVDQMVASRRPHYLVTANVDFLVQALHDVELRRILFEAHLVLCDGTPVLWASRWLGHPLVERVAGSDLVPLLIEIAARKGYRIFFLGGKPEATQDAVLKLQNRFPSLIIAGHYSPPFQDLLEMDHVEIKRRIQAARPDLLFVSFGCPKQEKWIAMHFRALQVPVSIGVGATIDFLSGRVPRAPLWMQRSGTEWLYRLGQEPRRLFRRYARDCWYFGTLFLSQWCRTRRRAAPPPDERQCSLRTDDVEAQEIQAPAWLDAEIVRSEELFWKTALGKRSHILLDLSKVQFLDSTGVGLLIRLRKRLGQEARTLVLVSPSAAVKRLLQAMQLWSFFVAAPDTAAGRELLRESVEKGPVRVVPGPVAQASDLQWYGEVTAANADAVWNGTEDHLRSGATRGGSVILDLSQVTFIDSTGVSLLVRAKKLVTELGARLLVRGAQEPVRNVLRLTKLEKYLLEVS